MFTALTVGADASEACAGSLPGCKFTTAEDAAQTAKSVEYVKMVVYG